MPKPPTTKPSPSSGSTTGPKAGSFQPKGKPKRGEVWELDLGKNADVAEADESQSIEKAAIGVNVGKEQSGYRSALIVADETACGWGLVMVVPSTGQGQKHKTSPHAVLYGSDKSAAFLVNQLRSVSTKRLKNRLFPLDKGTFTLVEDKIAEMLGLAL